MSILDKLNHLNVTKNLIRQAIIAKGVAVPESDTFRSYAEKVTAIPTGGSGGGGITGPQLRVIKLFEDVESGDIVCLRRLGSGTQYPLVGNNPDFMPSVNWTQYSYSSHIGPVALSGDGNFFVMMDQNTSSMYFVAYKWNAETLRYEKVTNADTNLPNAYVKDIAISDDGSVLAICGGQRTFSNEFTYTFKWNSSNNRYEKTADVYPARDVATESNSVALIGDGTRLIIGSYTSPGYTMSYNWNSGNNRFEAGNPFSSGCYVANNLMSSEYYHSLDRIRVSKDGNKLVSLSSTMYYFNWSDTNQRYEYKSYISGTFKNIALSGDGLTVVIADGRATPCPVIYKLNTQTNTWVASVKPSPFPFPIRDEWSEYTNSAQGVDNPLALNYDGTVLLAKYSRIRNPRFLMYKMDPITSEYVAAGLPSLDIPGYVRSLAITNDGTRMVACSADAASHTFHHYTDNSAPSLMAYKLSPTDQLPIDAIGIGYAAEAGTAGSDCQINLLWANQNVLPPVA